MKRLALLLGSLLVVTAAASAKEVVPAPVVVEEAPVQIIEKEVIVYREKEQGFRPNGYVDLQYKYYGQTEDQDKLWNTNDNSSRTQLEGRIQMTEKQALDFRVRDYNSFDEHERDNQTQTRLRYYYDHGVLGDSKVDMTSFVRYEKKDGYQYGEYQLRFQLADYMFNNDYVKTTTFVVGPRYIYKWSEDNSSDYTNTIGLYFDWINQLPFGFSTELEIDGLHYNMYGTDAKVQDGTKGLKEDSADISVGLKLMHNANLYTEGAYSLDWYFEGGYDTYDWSNLDRYGKYKGATEPYVESKLEDAKYSLYAQPSLVLAYQATEFVNLYTQVGAEYRNWKVENNSDAQDWRWQPFVTAGFNVAF
ncbi:major outer membrane protein FomA [Fusobacterium sp. HC1336]|uniref:major outer membrane protein FomA n=1 Tax=Fusobacterium sp. HC1336 TaxID=3171169 RepID=UPI003F1ED354